VFAYAFAQQGTFAPMSMHFAEIARQAAADGLITPDEILALRRDGWGDGKIAPAEADAVFAINDALAERSGEWCDFFVEAIGEYVLNTWEPKGYVTDEQAAWLTGKVSADGRLDSVVELELLVRVLESAANVPAALKSFVLGEVGRAVVTGTGPTRDGGALSQGCVTAAECAVLRRVIFAEGGDGPGAVGESEAEMLFRIKDASLGGANSPEWKRLFAQGIGNYLMGLVSADAQIGRDKAIELEAFMNDTSSSTARFLGRVLHSAREGDPASRSVWKDAWDEVFGGDKRDRLAELRAAEDVTPAEQAWLDAHVNADGKVDEYEQAVLDFIAENR
jgi:hypothetical protein